MNTQATILVVDDTPLQLEVTARLFRRHGCSVITATTGAEAIECTRNNRPDLVLLDVQLPDISGFEVLRQLKAAPESREIFVVLISAVLTDATQQAEGLDAGADGYITRPIGHRELLARVQAFLRLQRTQNALARSEERLRYLIQHQADGMLVLDEQGAVRFANHTAERLFGTGVDGLVGRVVEPRFVDGETREFKLSGPEVGLSFHEVRLVPIDWEGRPAQLTTLRDVTERRRTEAALHASEVRFHEIAENIDDVAWVYDPSTERLVYVSPAVARIWGRPGADFTTDSSVWVSSLHPDDATRATEAVAAVGRGELDRSEIEYRIVRPDGTVRSILDVMSSIRGPDGRVQRVTGLAKDITARAEGEKRTRLLNVELERRVKERTKELERVNHDLGAFAYVASHDLRTPLRGINQIAEWLLRDHAARLNPEGRELLAMIQQRVRALNRLVSGILEYSRAGTVSAPDMDIDVNRLVADVLAGLAIPMHSVVVIAPNLPVVRACPEQLHQIFQNLIDNAVKHLSRPDGRIEVIAERRPGAWQFTVADNGPGIPAGAQEKIFQLFQRLHVTTEPGSGIGLAVVKRLVERRGGQIWVDSRPGAGARFSFLWPDASLGGTQLDFTSLSDRAGSLAASKRSLLTATSASR